MENNSINIATKAALFNALLFPGWGHIYLKKNKRGILIILPVIAGMMYIFWSIFQTAKKIVMATPLIKGTVDIVAVVNLTMNSVREVNSSFYLILLLVLLLWVFSIIDAYLLGKKEQKAIQNQD